MQPSRCGPLIERGALLRRSLIWASALEPKNDPHPLLVMAPR